MTRLRKRSTCCRTCGELRDEFARPAPSNPQPRALSEDAPVKNPFPEEQRMVQAILEVVLGTTSMGEATS